MHRTPTVSRRRSSKDAQFDFVITLCDNARENCPVWPGQPIVAHWSSPDPAAIEGSDAEKRRAFWQVAQQIRRRLELLASLPFEKLDALRLEAATKEIGAREKIQIGNQTPALKSERRSMDDKPIVLILCTGNSCRSHIAEGVLRRAAGDLIDVQSAGSNPAG